jgi:hypothetical protein
MSKLVIGCGEERRKEQKTNYNSDVSLEYNHCKKNVIYICTYNKNEDEN